jgi:HSP20 family molecular chaperone IbpA
MSAIPIAVLHEPHVIVVTAELPDVASGSLRVDVAPESLSVRARAEFAQGDPTREFTYPIPVAIDEERSTMRFEEGVLRVVLVKRG